MRVWLAFMKTCRWRKISQSVKQLFMRQLLCLWMRMVTATPAAKPDTNVIAGVSSVFAGTVLGPASSVEAEAAGMRQALLFTASLAPLARLEFERVQTQVSALSP